MNSFMSMCSTLLLSAIADVWGLVAGRPEDVPCPVGYIWPDELEMEAQRVWLCKHLLCHFYVYPILWCAAVAWCDKQLRDPRRA
jgi:hypothetical protein